MDVGVKHHPLYFFIIIFQNYHPFPLFLGSTICVGIPMFDTTLVVPCGMLFVWSVMNHIVVSYI